MFALITLLALSLPSVITAAPTAPVGEWSLHKFGRSCTPDGFTCKYLFSISESTSAQSKNTVCETTVQASDPPSGQMGFAERPCASAPQYHVSGGHDPVAPFMVITVINVETKQQAFFGFDDNELADMRIVEVRTAPAFPLGEYSRSLATRITKPTGHQAGAEWTLENIHRNVDRLDNSIYMSLDIYTGEEEPAAHCTIFVQAPLEQDVRNYSWSHQSCEENGWRMSWGYNEDNDSAVATVIAPNGHVEGWFGWDHVNDSSNLPNVGPSKATACSEGC